MKLKACYWVPGLALLAAAPAWANSSWGQMGQFRPGIQVGIVVLVLLTETIVVGLMTQMPWLATAIAVALANGVSCAIGLPFMTGPVLKMTSLPVLLGMAVPSTLIEFPIVAHFAGKRSRRSKRRYWWAFGAVLLANYLSATVTFGYLQANYRGQVQPIPGREGARMRGIASHFRPTTKSYDADLQALCTHDDFAAEALRGVLNNAQPVPFDMAPPWLPWAVMRPALRYESAIPKRLDPPGKGRPMIWTGAPYLNGLRGVIFSDGRYEEMAEGDFRKLSAVPAPPQLAIPPPEPVR